MDYLGLTYSLNEKKKMAHWNATSFQRINTHQNEMNGRGSFKGKKTDWKIMSSSRPTGGWNNGPVTKKGEIWEEIEWKAAQRRTISGKFLFEIFWINLTNYGRLRWLKQVQSTHSSTLELNRFFKKMEFNFRLKTDLHFTWT